ncbi:cyclic lactone autoinducer peptide [Rummeliibacillus pycnus]|uniref:cyclic lactone autoinducer peptide n=1 Tax=Rummeliibacillus pycnus TaxID=101070 RepID=UPI0037CA56E1
MNLIYKVIRSFNNYVLSRLSSVALFVGTQAVVNSCTLFFHEEEIPKELQKNHPFKKNNSK